MTERIQVRVPTASGDPHWVDAIVVQWDDSKGSVYVRISDEAGSCGFSVGPGDWRRLCGVHIRLDPHGETIAKAGDTLPCILHVSHKGDHKS